MLRIIFTFLSFLILSETVFAQNIQYSIQPKYEAAGTFYDGIAPVKYKGLWGFINKQNEWIIDPTYKNLKPYRGGLIGVTNGDGWGYISKSGKQVTNLAYIDVAMSQDSRAALKGVDGKWNIIDNNGNFLTDFLFDNAPIFSEDYAPVKFKGLWGFVNKSGENFTPVKEATKLFRLTEGLAVFVQNDQRGYTNALGKKVIPAKYQLARQFSDGHAAVSQGNNADWMLINKNDINIFASEPHFRVREYSEGAVPVQTLATPPTWIFADIDGYGINGWESGFDAAYSFKDGLALIKKNGRFNFLDSNGFYAFQEWFDDAFAFNEGLAPVLVNNHWGYISKPKKDRISIEIDSFNKFISRTFVMEDTVKLNDRVYHIKVHLKFVDKCKLEHYRAANGEKRFIHTLDFSNKGRWRIEFDEEYKHELINFEFPISASIKGGSANYFQLAIPQNDSSENMKELLQRLIKIKSLCSNS